MSVQTQSLRRARPFHAQRLRRLCAVARAVRRLQVSVCKEQSPSSREDGWELVEEVEMDAGPQQNENLSMSSEARFVKFTILAGYV